MRNHFLRAGRVANLPSGGGDSLPVTANLLFHFDAADSSSGDSTWTDKTSNNYVMTGHGDSGNTPTYSSSDGGSWDFDGSSQYFENSSDIGTSSAPSAVTLIAFVKRDGAQSSWTGLVYGRQNSYINSGRGHGLHLYSSSEDIGFSWNNSWDNDSNLTIPDDEWCMVAVTMESGDSDFYLYQNSGTTTASNTATLTGSYLDQGTWLWRLGRDANEDNRYWDGKIAIALAYTSKLTQTELTSIWDAYKSRYFPPPTLSSSTPADGTTDFAVDGNIVLTFDKAVDADSGNIVIKKVSDNSTVETISVTGGQVSGSGTTAITINPSSDLTASTAYYINIDATAFDATSAGGGASYAGISDATTLNFTTAAAPSHVTSDLVMHLDADSYSGSGDWLDATSNDNDGSIDGATYSASSGSNPAYFSFDGSNDGVEITDTYSGGTAGGLKTRDLLSGSNNYSFSVWFQTGAWPTNTSWQNSPIIFKAGRRAVYILHGDSTAVDKVALHGWWTSGGWSQRVESNTLSLDTWYNICFTYNTTDGFVCYQNGSSVDTNSSPNNSRTAIDDNSWIGRISDADSYTEQRYWEGKMAIFSIYEKTLTSSEVTQNYNAFKSRFGLS